MGTLDVQGGGQALETIAVLDCACGLPDCLLTFIY